MLQTLRSRLILSHSLPLLIIIPLMGIALIYAMETRVVLPRSIQQLSDNASLVVDLTAQQPGIWQDREIARSFVAELGGQIDSRVMLLDDQGTLLASSDSSDASRIGLKVGLPAMVAVLQGETGTLTRHSVNLDAEVADVLLPVENSGGQVIGVVRLTHRLGNLYQDLVRVRGVVTGILLAGLALGVIIALVLAASLGQPVRQLAGDIEQMAAARSLITVPEGGIQEMQALVRTFNLMVDRLNTQDLERRKLLANLLHELGRPLGALKSAIDALFGGAADQAPLRDEMLTGMRDEIRLLQRLLDDLARLYDREVDQLKLLCEPTDVGLWLSQLLLSWQSAALAKDLRWETDIADDLPTLPIDPGRMAQAVGNLLSNAIKYTPAGGTVEISAGTEPGQLFIRVRDTGCGIAYEEQGKVFQPFYRGQPNRRFPQGMGLGLSIAKDLVLAHGGRLTLESVAGLGSTFTIWLPLPEDVA